MAELPDFPVPVATPSPDGGRTIDERVEELIRAFERRSPPRRISGAPAARARLGELGLSDHVTNQLWEQCFEPMLAQALKDQDTRRRALEENAGGVVLKAAVELIGRHPRRLDRRTAAAVLTGDPRLPGDDPLFGVATGVPSETIEGLLGQLVGKGLLAEVGGRLERP